MKKLIIILIILLSGCSSLKKLSITSPVKQKSDIDINNYYPNLMQRNYEFKSMKGKGNIHLKEGKYEWSAIFKINIISRDTAIIDIYGPLGMRVFTIYIQDSTITFDRESSYEAIADLLKSSSIIGKSFVSIFSATPLIDTEMVKVDFEKTISMKYSNIISFGNIKSIYPDSLYLRDGNRIVAKTKYSKINSIDGPYEIEIYSVIFDAYLNISFSSKSYNL